MTTISISAACCVGSGGGNATLRPVSFPGRLGMMPNRKAA